MEESDGLILLCIDVCSIVFLRDGEDLRSRISDPRRSPHS